MVRLVFRPYTQIWRSICTSESLRASTRVSSGFTLFRHSSPSFGSQHICSYSNLSKKIQTGRWCTLDGSHLRSLSFRIRVCHPNTRIYVRLLGPCFKTGRLKPLRQHPKHWCANREPSHRSQQAVCIDHEQPAIQQLQPQSTRQPEAITLPSKPAYLPPAYPNQTDVDLSTSKCTASERTADHLRKQYWFQAFPFWQFHVLFNSLFKVLFIFPSRYLFAIGLSPIFSFRWYLPPILSCIPKQPDS